MLGSDSTDNPGSMDKPGEPDGRQNEDGSDQSTATRIGENESRGGSSDSNDSRYSEGNRQIASPIYMHAMAQRTQGTPPLTQGTSQLTQGTADQESQSGNGKAPMILIPAGTNTPT